MPRLFSTLSLRLRLFLLLGGLVALLVAGQWWLVRSLTGELSSEVEVVALSVGRSLITAMDEPFDVLVDRESFTGEDLSEDEVGEDIVERHVSVQTDPVTRRIVRRETTIREPLEEIALPRAEGEDLAVRSTVVLKVRAEPGSDSALILEKDSSSTELEPIPIPRHGLDARLERFTRRLLLGSLGFLGFGLLAVALVAHRVSASLGGLRTAAMRVAGGELGAQAPEPAEREVGATVRAFNHMSAELARLEGANRELRSREHLAELGEVARGLAHSLRNPLNTLGLSLEELALGAAGSGSDPAELAAAARRQIQRIDSAVRSLLVLGAQGVEPAAVDLVTLTQDVALEALQSFGSRVRIRVEDTTGGGPAALHGISAELRAVLQALVINAAEASPEGGEVRIRLHAAGAGEDDTAEAPRERTIEVIDQGPGLPDEVRRHLFEPHVTTKSGGLGMGLYLAHRIVTSRYGGSLRLEEAAGGGTHAHLVLRDRQG